MKLKFLHLTTLVVIGLDAAVPPHVQDVFVDSFRVDQDIIHIKYYQAIQHVSKDIVDEGLEDRWAVC